MVWSDKSVESALNTYNAAIDEGVPDWYAMRLALDVAFEENGGAVKKDTRMPEMPKVTDMILSLLGAMAFICGTVVLIVAYFAAKG